MSVDHCVIPAAGLGTRLVPVTKSVPKEILPILDTPTVDYGIQEAIASGIKNIVFVVSPRKQILNHYYQPDLELEATLRARGKTDLLAQIQKIVPSGVRFHWAEQRDPLGLGHAVLMARPIVGNQPFAFLLPDELMRGKIPPTRQLIQLYERYGKSIVASWRVPRDQVSRYGIVEGKPGPEKGTIELARVVEKPKPEAAPSDLSLPGRYVFTSDLFDVLAQTKAAVGGEIQLSDAISTLAQSKGVLAAEIQGERFDVGDALGMLEASVAFALGRADLREGARALLKRYVK